jgi:hypothetical protein
MSGGPLIVQTISPLSVAFTRAACTSGLIAARGSAALTVKYRNSVPFSRRMWRPCATPRNSFPQDRTNRPRLSKTTIESPLSLVACTVWCT